MKVLLAADSDGFALKEEIKQYLVSENYEVIDKSETAAKDFVDATLAVAQEIQADEKNEKFGIVIDAYGVGSFMAATKLKGIIAAEVSDERSAYMTREHNNARIITMGSLIVGTGLAKRIAKEFLSSNYAGGRHQIRVDMLNKMA